MTPHCASSLVCPSYVRSLPLYSVCPCTYIVSFDSLRSILLLLLLCAVSSVCLAASLLVFVPVLFRSRHLLSHLYVRHPVTRDLARSLSVRPACPCTRCLHHSRYSLMALTMLMVGLIFYADGDGADDDCACSS